MTRRLQVLVDDTELRAIQRAARRRRMTVSEWVRQGLRDVRAAESRPDAREKLQVVRVATSHGFPTGDIEQILAEIELGYRDVHTR